MIERDAIVVGGGPAGAAAAWELTRHGIDCLVVDRASFPREKLCAGWITPEVLEDLEFEPGDYPRRFLTFEVLRISLKGLPVSLRSTQHSIRRFEFDAWLLERSGAPFEVHEVRRIAREDEHYVLDDRYRCRFLIGAGGTRCPVYRNLFRSQEPRRKILQAVTLELEYACDYENQDCHLWFLDQGLPGYSWYVPKADGFLNVGVGGIAHKLKERGDDIHRHWDLLVQRLINRGLIKRPPDSPSGYSYFLRGATKRLRLGNAFLVGDAFGLATRDMCEGIGPAVRSGLMAARAIIGNRPYTLETASPFTIHNALLHKGLEMALAG